MTGKRQGKDAMHCVSTDQVSTDTGTTKGLLYRNRYRIPSTRAPFWDYGWNGAYFITICTKNRENYFGEISDGKIELSEIGEIARQEWLKTFEMRPDMKLTMGEYVIMPNHFHAIIIIGEN